MRRTLFVTLTVVMAALVASAPVANAQNVSGDLEVASIHTTDADFQNATERTNVSVIGSGQSASVALESVSGEYSDGFESGFSGYSGETEAWSTTTSRAYEGSTAISKDADQAIDGIYTDSDLAAADESKTASVWVYWPGDGSAERRGGVSLVVSDGSGYVAYFDPNSGGGDNYITLYKLHGPSSLGSSIAQESLGSLSAGWYQINLKHDGGNGLEAWVSDGSSQIGSRATATDSQTDPTRAGLAVYDDDGVYDYLTLDGGKEAAPSGTYIGPVHDAEGVEEGFSNLTLTNASATVAWQADPDGDGTFTNISTATYTSDGNKTADLSGTTDDEWRVRVDFNKTGDNTTAELHAEGVLFNASAPSGSGAKPTGKINDYDGNISIDVNDSDFALAQGDSLTVTATNASGGQIGQTTITSNQTVTFDYAAPPGQSDITWTLSDSYGEETTVQQSFTLPAAVEIRNESAPSELVTLPNGTVEVRFYFDIDGDPVIVTRNASDGTVNMTGLPADRPFTIVVDGGDKFVSRRIFVESLYETQTVYLLPENETHVPTIFEVADYSGQFDQDESALLVQRAFNGSWGTVQGDLIGANERISTQLRVDARHRLVIVNAVTGDRRVLGPYTPVASGTQQVEITSDDEVSISGLGTQVLVKPDIGLLAARSTDVSGVVRSQSATIDNKTLTAEYTAPNGSTTTLASTTSAGDGEITTTVDLTDRANGTLTVQVTYNTAAGTMGSATRTYTIRSATTTQYSLLSVLGTIPSYFQGEESANAFKIAISLLLTLVLTAAATAALPIPTEVTATLALVQLGGWAVLGWLPYTIPFAAGVTAVGLAAIRRGL